MRGAAVWCAAGIVGLSFLVSGGVAAGAEPARRLVEADVVGLWALREVDGQAPSTADVKNLTLDIDPKGRWTAYVEMIRGRWLGRSVVLRGTWSIGGGVLKLTQTEPRTMDHTTGWLDGKRLVIDPDLIVRSNGWTAPASCAYERADGSSRE
jgi:hypothetical protein